MTKMVTLDNRVGVSCFPAHVTDDMTEALLGISKKDPTAWDEALRRYRKVVSTTLRSFRLQEPNTLAENSGSDGPQTECVK